MSVPLEPRENVLGAITAAVGAMPVEPRRRVPLWRDREGLYKCRFSSGLHPDDEDRRWAGSVDGDTGSVVTWAAASATLISRRTSTTFCASAFSPRDIWERPTHFASAV